jgi:predicted ATPase
MLLAWIGADVREPDIAIRTKARARLGGVLEEELPELSRMLRPPVEIDAGVTRAYVRWLELLAADRPVVVALEDSEWADDPAVKLAGAVLELTDRAPVALVVTQEPPGTPLRLRALGEYAHRTTELALSPLPDDAAKTIPVGVLGNSVDTDAVLRLVAEAEGNPLYLEELARAFQEGALEPRGRTWTISVGSAGLLPPALENLLVARIDRLPEDARRLAQAAAAIGRVFPVRVLSAVAGDDIEGSLSTLFRADVVRERTRYPEFECAFTHGLLQEAALSTLTSARTRELYARVGAAFESVYADTLDEHLERLAHYHAQSGDLPRALEYLERARGGSG